MIKRPDASFGTSTKYSVGLTMRANERRLDICAAGLLSLVLSQPALAADVDHGKQVFQTCAACHSDKPDALGPNLAGVIGRKAGSRDDFRYSNAMMRAGFSWDAGGLRQYLADPQAKVKGNRMPFSGLTDPKDVDDVIAYIETMK
jgi:cytochrome c